MSGAQAQIDTKNRYKAFISYSHRDKAVAKWLHGRLDGYNPPSAVGKGTATDLKRVRRRWRVFLDDEEFGAAASLSEKIQTAIDESENLVVICSPNAVKSGYVNDEIKLFKRKHGSNHVLAVIANGKPNDDKEECFPQAIKTAYGPDGAELGKEEPIAADLQVFDRRQVEYKIIAGVLGIDYGDLVDREHKRRMRRNLIAAGISVTVAILLVIAASITVLQAREAARNAADSFVQRGQRAAATFNLAEADNWFRRALAISDSPLAREGLIGTLDPPLKLEANLAVSSPASGKKPELTSITFVANDHVAIGDKSGFVRALDLSTGKEQWTKDLGGEISSVSFSASENQIAVGLRTGAVVWLSANDGSLIKQADLKFPVLSTRYDRGGHLLAIGMNEPGGIVVVDTTGKPVLELQHSHAGSVQGFTFNLQGDYIYWGGSGSYIWACPVGAQSGCDRPTRVDEWVYSIDGSRDSRFAAYSTGGKIQLLDFVLRKQLPLGQIDGHAYSVRFDPSSRYVAAAGTDGTIHLYDARAQRELFAAQKAHERDIYGIEFSPDSHRLVAVGLDGRVSVWKVSVKGAAMPPNRRQLPEMASSMLVAPQANRISEIRITHDNSALVRTWDQDDEVVTIDSAQPETPFPADTELANRLAASLDLARTSAFRLTEFSMEKLWSWEDNELPSGLKDALEGGNPDKTVTSLSRDRSFLAIIRSDGRAHVFDKALTQPYVFETGNGAVLTASMITKKNILLLAREAGQIEAYDWTSGKKLFETKCGEDPISYLLEMQSRLQFVSVAPRGKICLFSQAGERISQSTSMASDAVAMSPDESMIASGGVLGDVVLLSSFDLTEITTFRGHRGEVDALHFTLDSKYLVSGGADETLRVWPAGEARKIATIPIDELRRNYSTSELVGNLDWSSDWLKWFSRLAANLRQQQ
jgi:WD40 repeat protein